MVDCLPSIQSNNLGCGGGFLDSVGYYSSQYPIAQEKYYKYTAKQGTCNQAKIAQGKTFKIKSYAYTSDCISLLSTLMATKPIGVCGPIGEEWFSYSSGVMPNCGIIKPGGHCFLMVGGSSDGTTNVLTNFFKFKNSWGTGWGEKGYVRIYKDPNDNLLGPCNVCRSGLYSI
jgi:KDEL-tailed cysteine endopeptidase